MKIEQLLKEFTLEEKARFVSGGDFWHTQAVERLGIPAVRMTDGPNGVRLQKAGNADHLGINKANETVCYPTEAAMAASWDRTLLKQLGKNLGAECQHEGVGMLLGPGVNIKRSPLGGRNFEYFSEDPFLTGALAKAYIQGVQDQGVAACIKHFAGNNQETNRQGGNSTIDQRTLHEIYLPAFEEATKEGPVAAVMASYNALNGVFNAENKTLLTNILREKWGFEGMVVTDWGGVKDRVKGLEAGLDLEMPGISEDSAKQIIQAVKQGDLAEEVLDQAVKNIVKFVENVTQAAVPSQSIDRQIFAKDAENMAVESAVLLKNEQNSLPLGPQQTILYVGEFAQQVRYQGGGSSHVTVKKSESFLDVVGVPGSYARGYNTLDPTEDADLRKEAVSLAQKAETVVVFVGLTDKEESEGFDRVAIDLPANQNQLIEAILRVNKNVVVVLHVGSAVLLPWFDQVKAVLNVHLGGSSVGRATKRLLFGESSPSGKLAETWPLRLEDTPAFLNFPGDEGNPVYHETIYVGYRYYDKKQLDVQFPFGFGLSYTTFAYSDLVLEEAKQAGDSLLKVTVTIRNTGKRKAKEIVQLYLSQENPQVGRPSRELKGFEKIELEPGQSQVVSIDLTRRSFAYYEPKINDFYTANDRYLIEVGSSSRDIRLREFYECQGNPALPLHFTAYSTMREIAQTAIGQQLVKKISGDATDTRTEDGMGLSQQAKQEMALDMPLRNLVTFGALKAEEVTQILKVLNQKEG